MILASSGLSLGARSWRGRWHFEANGWSFKLDSRPDLSKVMSDAHDREQEYVMTHVGEIRRADGQLFGADDVAEVIFAWQLAFSFALGRWVAPAVPVGFSRTGQRCRSRATGTVSVAAAEVLFSSVCLARQTVQSLASPVRAYAPQPWAGSGSQRRDARSAARFHHRGVDTASG